MQKKTILGLILLAFCLVCRFVTPVADFYAVHLYPAISAALSFLSSVFPFSLEEIVVLGFVVTFVGVLVKAFKHKEGFFRWLGKTAMVVVWLYVWFYMGWGNNYYRMGLYQRNGIQQVRYEEESFKRFLEDFTGELNRAAAEADRYDREQLEAEIKAFYTDKVNSYGYAPLRRWQHVKKPLLNRLYSAVLVHGYMGPFFCESQVNGELLESEYPYTAAHEMGHLAGGTSEAEANYWGYVCCRQSASAAVRYSGYLGVLPYVMGNAYALLPEEDYYGWTATISDRAKADYSASREYWKGKRVLWIDKAQSWFYNLYLKSNGVSEGIKDYYGVVSMMITMDAAGI